MHIFIYVCPYVCMITFSNKYKDNIESTFFSYSYIELIYLVVGNNLVIFFCDVVHEIDSAKSKRKRSELSYVASTSSNAKLVF